MKKNLWVAALVIIVSGIAAWMLTNNAPEEEKKKPNLLFIIADQYRYDALSIAGNKALNTPNLDRLAAEGAFFSNAYTPCAVCAPARASILTGHTVENSGMLTNGLAYEPESSGVMAMKTFDEILDENGYTCEYYGKWHASLYKGRVYKNEVAVAGRGQTELGRGMKTQYQDYLDANWPKRDLKPGEMYGSYSDRPYMPNPIDKRYIQKQQGIPFAKKFPQTDLHGQLLIPEEHSVTAWQASETIEAIERLKDETFSITCSFHLPHAPMLPTEPYFSMFKPEDMKLPVSLLDSMPNSPYVNANGRKKNPEYADPEKIKYMIANYYALVTEVDVWVGKIMDKLDELGLSENTMVIFTSDHGEMLGSHGMREKNVFYEESAHIPLMIKYPDDIKGNAKVDGYVSTMDLFDTILDYMGVSAVPSDAESLRGLMDGSEKEHGKYVVTEWLYRGDVEPNFMIVKDGWKMFVPSSAESEVIDVLYNLNEDPFEMNNLLGANTERDNYNAKVNELQADLLEWLKKTKSSHYEGVKNRKIL